MEELGSKINQIAGQRSYYDLLIAEENPNTIDANVNEFLAIELKNPTADNDFLVLGLQLRFQGGLENCVLAIRDNNSKEIINGKLSFAQIGNKFSADVVRDELPIQFVLKGNKKLFVIVSTKNIAIQKGDINVCLFGRLI